MDNNQSFKVSCLSSEEHNDDIRDDLAHYLGCIEICKRRKFFTDENDLWQNEIVHRTENLRLQKVDAEKEVHSRRESWEDNCLSELNRIKFLRKTLAEDEYDNHLVKQLECSGAKWRDSCIYKTGIKEVKRWTNRERRAPLHDQLLPCKRKEPYDLKKDLSVPIIQFEDGEGKDVEDSRVWNKFPNQKVTLSALLEDYPRLRDTEEKNLLSRKPFPNGITYFHIPCNNMIWAEISSTQLRAISGKMLSCKTAIGVANCTEISRRPPHIPGTYILCVREYHQPPNNFVLFMPYLHWESSRKRQQFAKEICSIIRQDKDKVADILKEQKETRQQHRLMLSKPQRTRQEDKKPSRLARLKIWLGLATEGIGDQATSLSIQDLFGEVGKNRDRLMKDSQGRFELKNPLGQYLLDATRLYEGMANYRDKMVLRNYLTEDPPLHPRRTLDQAYYWILDSTGKRDRDQVVYRGTTAKQGDFHRYDRENDEWVEHKEFRIEGECDKCRTNIQKLSRVVMVDQLWMWILDESTIITCFPKRYGANKQDLSGVHKSIRIRLQDGGSDQVRSVYDLALIIIAECSSTFFDRTKKVDRQPQVIDEFSKAIGNVTAAFERLWNWTDKASKVYRSKGNSDASELHVPLLDINPEGKLQREIKDIIEELDIMIHITKTQKDVLTTFIGFAKEKLEPVGGTNYKWFKLNADERLADIQDRIEKLQELRNTADNTATSVGDLLELKQQQASVVQAWQAVKQSEETVRQGRSIMVFTIVTIVFLPLSFMSSVFGMNNIEFSGDSWAVKDEFEYMFPISAGAIFCIILLAFSAWIRSSIWFICKVPATKLVVWLRLYDCWLQFNMPSKAIHQNGINKIERLKEEAKLARFTRDFKRRVETETPDSQPSPEPEKMPGDLEAQRG
ncbi:hypothetical protein DL770_000073 [Monosporascus sp. CRB-9-2]|nr:hypothetical protein DL770_000073 [Monosporascus sp. CRB-9-2]